MNKQTWSWKGEIWGEHERGRMGTAGRLVPSGLPVFTWPFGNFLLRSSVRAEFDSTRIEEVSLLLPLHPPRAQSVSQLQELKHGHYSPLVAMVPTSVSVPFCFHGWFPLLFGVATHLASVFASHPSLLSVWTKHKSLHKLTPERWIQCFSFASHSLDELITCPPIYH